MRCSDFTRFGKSVGENQAAFGVCVVDHDGFAVLGFENVARQYGLVADGVFGEAADGAHVDGEFECCNGLDGGKCGGCTAHVANHLGHGFGRFQTKSASIERETLADDDEVVFGRALGGLVVKRNHVRLAGATLADGHVAHEAFFFELLHVAHLDGKPRRVFGNCLCVLDEFGGVEVGGTSVDEVLRKGHRFLFDGDFFGNFLERGGVFTGDDFIGDLEIRFLLALVCVELVVRVMQTVDNGLELFVGGVGKEYTHAGNLLFHGAAGEAVGCHAQVVEVRKPAFLGGVDKQGVVPIDFQEFEIFEGAILHAFEDGFHLGATGFGKHLGKLDGLLDKK